MIWQPTWEAADLLSANPDLKTYVNSYENADTSTQPSGQPEDQEIDNLKKQGYDGCTQHFDYMWDSSQGQNIRDKAFFITDTVNPQLGVQPTGKCEIWVRDVNFYKPGIHKDSKGEPKISQHLTCQAARVCDIHGKCTGRLSLKRPNILLHAYNQTKRIGLHNATQPPVLDAATEIAGLLQRYKL